jgi:hypothetical protein
MGFSFCVDLHVVVNGNLSVRAHEFKETILRTLPAVLEVLVRVEPETPLTEALTCRAIHGDLLLRNLLPYGL